MSQTQIPDALERIFLHRGWFNVYQQYIPDLQQPNFSNEMYARCPWRDITDNHSSFSVNAGNGLFTCFRTGRGGNYLQFRAYMDSTVTGPDGYIIPLPIKLIEEIVMGEEGIVPPSEEWINECHLALIQSQETISFIQQFKPWFLHTMQTFQIGYDWETYCFVIPIRDEEGKLINAKLYNPTGQPKMRWKVLGLSGNYLYPHTAINDDDLIIVEGETKVLTLRGLGFNAISGTAGGNSPIPSGNWYRNRRITIIADKDATGERAKQKIINAIRGFATELKCATIPEWDDMPQKADICDYVFHMILSGMDTTTIHEVILEMLENAELISSINTAYNAEPTVVNFSSVLEVEQLNERVSFVGKVSARSEKRYISLTRYGLNCPGRGYKFCDRCIMKTRYEGNAEFVIDRRSADQLKLIATDDTARLINILKINGIPSMCPEVTMTPLEWIGYEPTLISYSMSEQESNNEISDNERHRREAFFIVNPSIKIEENRDYRFTGFLYPDPKSQSGLIVIDSSEPLSTTAEMFEMTPEIAESLKSFQPDNSDDLTDIVNMMNQRGSDLSESVTGIKGRFDLHIAMSLVYHSPIQFYLGTQKIQRGWLELLVIGDTRSGKSVTFRMLAKHYDLGVLVDCKNQTTAGLLGAVNNSSITGERYITAGLLPQNDKGVVCLDEMEGAKLGHTPMLEALASMRSEGIVRITKAAQAQFPARVRLICMANPGKRLLIKETGKTGAELILSLIPQPENIARFDAALAVAIDDVSSETIHASAGLENPKWSVESQHNLLMWIYSRKAEQINFTTEAEAKVREVATQMCQKYDSTLPIVEPSDQKNRVAKWSVAIAGFLFSSDTTYENIIVNENHVNAAHRLLEYFYDKPVMGYDRFSADRRQKRILEDEPEIRRTFESIGKNKYRVAKQLLSLDEISDRAFKNLINGPAASQMLHDLIHNNCLKLVYGGRRDNYEKNPVFTQWLLLYVNEENVK